MADDGTYASIEYGGPSALYGGPTIVTPSTVFASNNTEAYEAVKNTNTYGADGNTSFYKAEKN